MDILIQSLASGRYLANQLRWTTESRDSLLFHSTVKALDFCKSKKLDDVRLVLKFEGGDRYDLSLPVPSGPHCRLDSR
jgi:hypothetical protein